MFAYIPYMDPMGEGNQSVRWEAQSSQLRSNFVVARMCYEYLVAALILGGVAWQRQWNW